MERWAAVVTCWCDGVYGYRWIVYPGQPERYVRQIAEELSQWMSNLVEHYAEDVNCAELDLLHESFGSGPYSEDDWTSWILRPRASRRLAICLLLALPG